MGFFFFEKIICGYDGIGRRAGFRFLCREACGFDPHYPYQQKEASVRMPLFCCCGTIEKTFPYRKLLLAFY